MLGLQQSIICVVVMFLVHTYWRYRKAVKMVSNFPGLRLLVSPMSPLGLLLPALPFPFTTYPGFSFPWELKHKGLFEKFKCDTVSLCAVDGRALLFTADVPFITKISSFASREIFPKPVEEYKVLSYLGNNLVVCEGESWRRQRRIGAPAFSKEMFERLWLDMHDIVCEMVDAERWRERTDPECQQHPVIAGGGYLLQPGEMLVPHIVDLTLRMALAAIARAGFGMDFEWEPEASFTRVCQGFGRPQRWRWWLSFLQFAWIATDTFLFPLYFVIEYIHASFRTDFVFFAFIWNFVSLTPLRWAWNVVIYLIAEFGAVFARPNRADFVARGLKIHEALHIVAKDSTLRLAIPKWMIYLPFRRMRRMRLAFHALETELQWLMEERKAFHQQQALAQETLHEEFRTEDRSDLLNNLVKAAIMDEGDLETSKMGTGVTGNRLKGLTDEEIIGNTYIYFLAGHETTAHSLAWTLALLAAYPQHQDSLIEEIDRVWPRLSSTFEPFHSTNTIEDYTKFPFTLACYSETLRLFPPVQMIPKVVAREVCVTIQASKVVDPTTSYPSVEMTIPATRPGLPKGLPSSAPTLAPSIPVTKSSLYDAECFAGITESSSHQAAHTSFVVQKGTIIFIDPPGVHYNPRYWENPDVFDPTRFLRPYNKDAFIPFGVGHRACLGRKFSEVESVATLVHLLRNYSVHLAPTSVDGSIDVTAARAKFSEATVRITLTPTQIPLIFRRRV